MRGTEKQPPPRLQGRRSIFAAARWGHGGLGLATACIAFANFPLSGTGRLLAPRGFDKQKTPYFAGRTTSYPCWMSQWWNS